MTLLWGDRQDAQARQSLRQCLTRLRKELGPDGEAALVTEGDLVSLDRAAVRVDVAEFHRRAVEGSQDALAEATQMYDGRLADGLDVRQGDFEDWLTNERNKLTDLACRVFEQLASAQASGWQPETAIATARRLIDLDPLFERGHRILMRAFMLTGQRTAALKQYRTCKEVLSRELDAAPSRTRSPK